MEIAISTINNKDQHLLKLEDPKFNNVVELVNQLIHKIDENNFDSDNGALVSNKILYDLTKITYIRDMIVGINEETDIIESLAASSEEMASSIDDVSNFVQTSTEKTDDAVKSTKKLLSNINSAINETVKNIESFSEIKETLNETQNDMKSIRDMVNIIKDIADQTNLLALNASIEAARAGDVGNGFAVVANEIKKLAESTAESVDFIEKSTNKLVKGVGNISDRITKSDDEFRKSNEKIKSGANEMSNITGFMEDISNNMMSISSNIEEQNAVSEEIASGMSSLLEKSNNQKELSNNTGMAIYELSIDIDKKRTSLWSEIENKDIINSIEIIITDHMVWKWRIYNMILGYNKIKANDIGDHHNCRLGKSIDKIVKNYPQVKEQFDKLEKPHALLHENAKKAAQAYNAGDTGKAEDYLAEMERLSHNIESLLRKIIDYIKRKN